VDEGTGVIEDLDLRRLTGEEFEMKALALATGLALLLAVSGCATMNVTIDYDEEADFSKYQTFDWIKQKPKPPRNPRVNAALLDKRVRSAVEDQLVLKGIRRVTSEKPDFLIAYHIGAQNKVDVTTYGYHYGPRGRRWGRHVEVHRYKEGTLILDFVDPAIDQLVWRGSAVGAARAPAQLEERIIEAVAKILAEFPPE
jgi:hypothetical protein